MSQNTSAHAHPDRSLRAALRLALLFATAKLALHLLTTAWVAHIGYGYFRDEFYYLACGRHLAWGYVDHGPLVAIQARLAETLFGHSLVGLRLLSAVAGAARVFLTGVLAFLLGGRRTAQALAMLGVLLAPNYLGIDSFLSMNSFESLFWMTCLVALLSLQHRLHLTAASEAPPPAPRSLLTPWLLFGLVAGLGLLNKPSMTFFLVALAFALLLTPVGRALLLRREALLGITLLLAIATPNLIWQVTHHWPTLEFLENGRRAGKNRIFPPLTFLNLQVQALNPLSIFLWLPGLIFLLRRAALRWLGLTFIFFLAIMMALHAKDYYVTPVYPVLFAAGGVAWERLNPPIRRVAIPAYAALLFVSGLLILPMAIPILPPQAWLRYTAALHLRDSVSNSETSPTGPLPQFYADRFGWQEETDLVTHAYRSLSPADQARVLLFGNNYGEAGALDILSSYEHLGLPPASSGQNSYWSWGIRGRDPNLVIAVVGDTPARLRTKYQSVTVVGHLDNPYAMPFEHKNVYILRDRRPDAPFNWADERFFY